MDTQSLLNPQYPGVVHDFVHKRAGQATVLGSRLGRSGSQKVWLCLFLGSRIACCVSPAARRYCCNSPARAWSYVTGCRRAGQLIEPTIHAYVVQGPDSKEQSAVRLPSCLRNASVAVKGSTACQASGAPSAPAAHLQRVPAAANGQVQRPPVEAYDLEEFLKERDACGVSTAGLRPAVCCCRAS